MIRIKEGAAEYHIVRDRPMTKQIMIDMDTKQLYGFKGIKLRKRDMEICNKSNG